MNLPPSPYPWWYTAMWPWFYRRPGNLRFTNLRRPPITWERAALEHGELVRLLCIGDIMVQQGDRVPVLHPELAELLGSADLILANCEGVLNRLRQDPTKRFDFCFSMSREYLEGLLDQVPLPRASWVLNTSNNHSGDCGPRDYEASVRVLDDMGVAALGVGARPPLLSKYVRGVRLGFTGWTEWENVALPAGTIRRAADVRTHDWSAAKCSEGIDFLLGMPHWGYEFQHHPTSGQRAAALQLSGIGIDLVVGSHPHVVQPIEHLPGGNFCAHSLGNFIGLGVAWQTRLIPVLELLVGHTLDSSIGVVKYVLHPFVQIDGKGEIPTAIDPLAITSGTVASRCRRRLKDLFESRHEVAAP